MTKHTTRDETDKLLGLIPRRGEAKTETGGREGGRSPPTADDGAESPASSARFVGRVNVSGKLLARPHSARERNTDLSLARSRLLNKPDDVTVGVSYTCDQSSAHRFLHERADL